MKTTLVNIHHKLPYDVYIGRGSVWGNPFSHLEGTTAKFKVKTREEAVAKYKEWILTQPNLIKKLYTLRGKRLGCYCSPKLCHGNVLIELIEGMNNMSSKKAVYKIENTEQLFSKWMDVAGKLPVRINAMWLLQNEGEASRDKLNSWVKSTDEDIARAELAFAKIIEDMKKLKQETIDYIIKSNK